jgi:hypothetical protein
VSHRNDGIKLIHSGKWQAEVGPRAAMGAASVAFGGGIMVWISVLCYLYVYHIHTIHIGIYIYIYLKNNYVCFFLNIYIQIYMFHKHIARRPWDSLALYSSSVRWLRDIGRIGYVHFCTYTFLCIFLIFFNSAIQQ